MVWLHGPTAEVNCSHCCGACVARSCCATLLPVWNVIACTATRSSTASARAASRRRAGSACTRSSARPSGISSRRTSAAACSPSTAARGTLPKSSTVAAFALGDYEWLLPLEADEPIPSSSTWMRDLRHTDARRYVKEEVPFYTGRRLRFDEARSPRCCSDRRGSAPARHPSQRPRAGAVWARREGTGAGLRPSRGAGSPHERGGDTNRASLSEIGGQRARHCLWDALRRGECDLGPPSLKDLPTTVQKDSSSPRSRPAPTPATWRSPATGPHLARAEGRVCFDRHRLAAAASRRCTSATPRLRTVDLRGNVDSRLRRVAIHELDAVIPRRSGRLDGDPLGELKAESLGLAEWPTAPGQELSPWRPRPRPRLT